MGVRDRLLMFALLQEPVVIARDDDLIFVGQFSQPVVEVHQDGGVFGEEGDIPGVDEHIAIRNSYVAVELMGIRQTDYFQQLAPRLVWQSDCTQHRLYISTEKLGKTVRLGQVSALLESPLGHRRLRSRQSRVRARECARLCCGLARAHRKVGPASAIRKFSLR
jgi:hypothetical protein